MTDAYFPLPDTLAILGGLPRFNLNNLHVNLPSRPDREKFLELISNCVDNNKYTNNGPLLEKLEEKIAHFLGVTNCILVANATLGIQLTAKAMELSGEVIVPAFTFIGTASALEWQGLRPVFCDVDPNTHTICPKHCRELINSKTTAILGVHLWGRPCPVIELQEIAIEYNLRLFYDSAHAFGCGIGNRLLASFGDAEIFSFHATKAFQSGEGGAITTNNDALATKLRRMRNFGFLDFDKTACLGINGKMSEFHAALGLVNFESFNKSIEQNKVNYNLYCSFLSACTEISILRYTPPHNFHYVVVEIRENARLTRDELWETLTKEGILARRYFYPGCHRMQPFGTLDQYKPLYHTDQLTKRCLVLPGGPNIKPEEIALVCKIIYKAFEENEAIRVQINATAKINAY